MAARSLLMVLVLAAALASSHAQAAVELPAGFVDDEMAGGLHDPTSFAFLPDGRMLALEQFTGAIRLVVNGRALTPPLMTLPDQVAGGEQGALAITVDDRWPSRPFVYVFHCATGSQVRVLRYTAFGELGNAASGSLALGSRRVVIDGLPDQQFNHNGGALRFGPDGMLYLSLGDDGTGCPAQDSTSLRGCILRLDVRNVVLPSNGAPPRSAITPADNPFVSSPHPDARLVYAYGFRNPFRFEIDPATGRLYVADVGEDTWEELDEITAGTNAGWPLREGPASFSWSGCPEPGGAGTGKYAVPIDSYDHDEGLVVIAAGVYRTAFRSPSWPRTYDGNVFYADYYSGFMRMLKRGANGWVRATAPGQPDAGHWAIGLERPAEFRWGPDGHLWYLSMSLGAIHRIAARSVTEAGPSLYPARLALEPVPNPAAGPVRLAYALPRPAHVRLAVYDLSGRRLATLAEGALGAGRHEVEWSGRDARGRAAGPGVYLAVLEADGARITRRIARIR